MEMLEVHLYETFSIYITVNKIKAKKKHGERVKQRLWIGCRAINK